MAYVPTYAASDIAPITFDVVGSFMAALAGQMGPLAQLIILLVIIGVVGGLVAAIGGLIGAFKSIGKH